ncbi:MAG: hypothetical protein L0Y58_06235 [Verrucomicrobia subdivision 3 bacterium]|nr:hypothetical protein [Limisphaerales bacterium]
MSARVLLILSICINAALGGYLVFKSQTKSRPPGQGTVASPAATRPVPKVADSKTLTVTIPAGTAFDWRIVESEDYKKYIANLRAIGCPEETIRDIIIADVNKLFEARKKEIGGSSTNRFQYWRGGNFFTDLFNEEKLAKYKELAKEKQALLKELLGIEVAEKPDPLGGMNPYETLLDFLPADKHSGLMDLEQKYAAKLMKSMKDLTRNPSLAREIQREKEAEMAKLLSPQEKEEYDLRMSQTAMIMRMQMGDFEMTENEFRDAFKLRKAFDDEFSVMGVPSNTQGDRDRRAAAQKELDVNLKAVLGEDRFREYRYDQELASSSLNDIAKEHNVPKQQAYKVFELKSVAQEQANAVRKDQSLTPEQRQAALDAIQTETRNAVNSVLGSTAGDAYFAKGSWLRNLNRPGQSGSQ